MAIQTPTTALSIKQPWAALVLAGAKTIEIRRWRTTRRGRILIHAAGVPDDRAEGWRLVTKAIEPIAHLRGGVIGSVELVECKHYTTQEAFDLEQSLHRNEPSWFESAGLFGFVFANPEVTAFRKYPGWFRFFTVKDAVVPRPGLE